MQDTTRNHLSGRAVIITLLLVGGLACLCLPPNFAPEIIEDLPEAPIPPPEPEEAVPQEPAPIPNALNAEGPWLMVQTDSGMWAANPDGSGLARLTEQDYWNGFSFLQAMQPGGDRVAFVSYDAAGENPALNLLFLPDGRVEKVSNLTTPEAAAAAEAAGSQALRALGGLAWSPAGTRLAFVGLLDGPSSEVYLYTLATEEIQRVSQDEAENYDLSWSPDGETLLYFGTENFGTGAGFETSGVWSARGDGTDVTRLYEPSGGAEEVVGWLDDTTAVINSWIPNCPFGEVNLRLFDVRTRQSEVVYGDCFLSAAANSLRGTVLFANEQGLYLLTADDRSPTRISEEPVRVIEEGTPDYSPFVVRFEDGSVATFGNFSEENQVSPISGVDRVKVVSYGLIWAWASSDSDQPGVWISGPGMEIGQIYSGSATNPLWDPDNNLLFFSSAGGDGWDLYRATFPGYKDAMQVGSIDSDGLGLATWLGW